MVLRASFTLVVVLVIGLTMGAALLLAIDTFNPFWHAARDIRIDQHYRIIAADTVDDASLDYVVGPKAAERIPSQVTAYGANNDYIVAAVGDIPVSMRFFYIVKRSDGPERGSGAVRGPFDAKGISIESQRLGLPQIENKVR